MTSFVAEDLSVETAMGIYGGSGAIALLCCLFLEDTTGKDLRDSVDRRVFAGTGHIELQEVEIEKETPSE